MGSARRFLRFVLTFGMALVVILIRMSPQRLVSRRVGAARTGTRLTIYLYDLRSRYVLVP